MSRRGTSPCGTTRIAHQTIRAERHALLAGEGDLQHEAAGAGSKAENAVQVVVDEGVGGAEREDAYGGDRCYAASLDGLQHGMQTRPIVMLYSEIFRPES